MNALFQLKKRFRPLGFFTPRALVALLLCGTACLTVTGTLPAFFRPGSADEGFAKNFDLCRTRSLSTSY